MNNAKYNRVCILIKNELFQLDISPTCEAYDMIYDQCINAWDILSFTEIKEMIQELCDLYPVRYFRG